MRFTVNRQVFEDAVLFAVKMLPARNPQPLLGGVLLEAYEDSLTASIFNFEVSSRTSVRANVIDEGTVLIPGRLLGEIAHRLPQHDVEIFTDGSKICLSCGSATYHLPSMPAEEYPEIPRFEHAQGIVPGDEFSEAISQVIIAAARDDSLPIMTAVNVVAQGNTLKLIASDRYRVAVRGIHFESTSDEESFEACVPAKFLQEVGKIFSNAQTVEIARIERDGREMIAFSSENQVVTSQLLSGKFPPVERLFPSDTSHYAVMSTQELVDAVSRVALVGDRESPLRFTFQEGRVSIESVGIETAQAEETVDVHLSGEPITFSILPHKIIEGARSSLAEYVRIVFSQASGVHKAGPLLITGHHSKDEIDETNYKYLAQPNLTKE